MDINFSDDRLQAIEEQVGTHPHWEQQIARLKTLQKISCQLNSKLDLEEVLTTILDEAIQALGAERGCLWLVDAATNSLELHLRRYIRSSDLKGRSFQYSRTVIERVWQNGEPVLTANAAEDPRFSKADSVISYTLRSILCVPLHIQGQKIGVLYLDNRVKTGQFQEGDLALAVAIADQAAIALHNARLHQEVVDRARRKREMLQRIQSLNQISLKAQGLTSFPDLLAVIGEELEQFGHRCAIALLSADGAWLAVQHVSFDGIAGPGNSDNENEVPYIPIAETVICRQVLEARNGWFVSDMDDVMSELLGHSSGLAEQPGFVAPLVANRQAIGLLVLGLDDTKLEDSSLLMAFANQAAATIEMSRLHTKLQQRLAELQSALAITRAMVREVSIDSLLEFIIAQAEHLTNAEGSAVLLLSEDGQWLKVAAPSFSPSRMKAGSRLLAWESLPGLAIASQKVQVCNHLQDSTRTASIRALLKPFVLRSLLCAPLVARGKNLGALMVWNKRGQAFNQNDNRLMGLFADQAALAFQNAHLQALNRQLAIEQERHRLARDLHDSVTQSLYSIGLAAQTSLKLLSQAGVDGRVRGSIEHIQSTSRTALAEIREQLYDLYPTALADNGLVKALEGHFAALREQYSLAIEFRPDQEPPLSTCQREALYYIAREALWNVAKHAGATRVDASLQRDDDHVILSIVDDGAGFDPSAIAREQTIGFRNMRERTKQVGGTFELESEPGQGTRITARIPVPPSSATRPRRRRCPRRSRNCSDSCPVVLCN